jgi:hypothetical protein
MRIDKILASCDIGGETDHMGDFLSLVEELKG